MTFGIGRNSKQLSWMANFIKNHPNVVAPLTIITNELNLEAQNTGQQVNTTLGFNDTVLEDLMNIIDSLVIASERSYTISTDVNNVFLKCENLEIKTNALADQITTTTDTIINRINTLSDQINDLNANVLKIPI